MTIIYCGIIPYRGHDNIDVQKHDQRVHGPLDVHDATGKKIYAKRGQQLYILRHKTIKKLYPRRNTGLCS